MARYAPFVAALLMITPAYAEDVTVIAPVFSQLITMTLPDGFVQAFEQTKDDFYINEAVLAGESVNNWTQMLTMTGLKGKVTADPAADVVAYAENLASGYAQACPDTFSAVQLTPPAIKGATGVFLAYLGCPVLADGGPVTEAAVILFMAGARDLYSLQWAERFDVSAGAVPYDEQHWQPRVAALIASAEICDRVEGELPPYPSCIAD